MKPEMTGDEMFAIMDGMNQVNIAMAQEIERNAPRCHMKPMCYEQTDSVDGFYEKYWECSVCGHTKED